MKFKQANDYALLKTELMYSDAHKLVIALINRYVSIERSTTAETALAEFVFDDIEPQALTILSVCVMNGRKAPFQSLIGMLSSALLHKNLDSGKVIATNLCVAEFIMASPEIFIRHTAFFGGIKYECTLFNEETDKKLFQLPSFDKPSRRHRNLGKFQWDCTQTTAVDKLNTVALVMLDIEEDNIPPEGTEDRVKYNIRASMRPYLAEKETPMFFDWNQDYRGRMYSSGKMLATLS